MDKSITCCFTGPRPAKLPWKYKEEGLHYLLFRIRLKRAIVNAIKEGYTTFITGMAIGIDTIAAETVLELKHKYPQIRIIGALPCKNQCCKWSTPARARWNRLLHSVDEVVLVSEREYYDGCMQKRNKYMVDNSSKVIAIYNNTNGGTEQTINYAISQGRDVVIIKP